MTDAVTPRKSPAGFRHYRSLVEKSNAEGVVLRTEFAHTDAVFNWFEITQAESEAILIDPRLTNALLWAYMRYLNFMEIAHYEFTDVSEADRAAYPEYLTSQASVDAAAGFMADACDLPWTQCLMWACRAQVQTLRSALPPEISHMTIWSPINPERKLDDEEAFYRGADHWLPARGRCGHEGQGPVSQTRIQ